MEIAIISSKLDNASLNIKNCLINSLKFVKCDEVFENEPVYKHIYFDVKLFTISEDLTYINNIDDKIKAKYFIFISRHESESKFKTLSIHTPGNFQNATFGGIDNKLCIAPALLLKFLFIKLNEFKINDYNVTLEVTHHGPFLNTPVIFIEIGSSNEEWLNEDAGNVISNVILSLIENYNVPKFNFSAIGIGGPHYCAAFNKLMLENEYAIGHICPKYNCEFLNYEMLKMMIEKTYPKAEVALIDWKGVPSNFKKNIIKFLDELNFKFEKI